MTDKTFLDKLSKLHSLLEDMKASKNQNSPYAKYYMLRRVNGEACTFLPIIAKDVDLPAEILKLIESLNAR